MDNKVNTNHQPNYEKPYPIIRELLKKKMDMKRIPRTSQQSKPGVEQNHGDRKSAERKETDANINRREERTGKSPTLARSKPSSCESSKTLATQTGRKRNRGDGSDKEKKRFDNKNEISPNQLQQYEKIFLKNILIKEGFKTKLDKKKLNTFTIWFNCVEYQFMRGRVQDEMKKSIIKKFCKKDDVFGLNVLERNRVVRSGIDKVKEVAFVAFKSEFSEFVNSAEYHNACNYCGKFYYV